MFCAVTANVYVEPTVNELNVADVDDVVTFPDGPPDTTYSTVRPPLVVGASHDTVTDCAVRTADTFLADDGADTTVTELDAAERALRPIEFSACTVKV